MASPLAGVPNSCRSGLHVSNRRARRYLIAPMSANHRSSVFVESEIFDRIVIREAARLPSGGMTALDDKKRDSGGITGAGIEQRTQNFLLRRAQLDFGNGARQIRRTGCGSALLEDESWLVEARLGGDLFDHPADNLGAQLSRMAVQDLANHPFHNWFDPTALLHCVLPCLLRAYNSLWGTKGLTLLTSDYRAACGHSRDTLVHALGVPK